MATIKYIVKGNSEISSIYLRFKEGRLIDLTVKTNFSINCNDWSETKGLPKNLKDANLKKLHNGLINLSAELLNHYNNTSNKLDINSKWLKDFINPTIKATDITNKLIEYWDYYALHKTSTITYKTKKKLTVQKHLLERFQKTTKTEYLIKDVNANFKLNLENYCNNHDYAPNTISQLIKTIKTICYHAQNNGIEVSNQLNSLTIKWQKVDKIF